MFSSPKSKSSGFLAKHSVTLVVVVAMVVFICTLDPVANFAGSTLSMIGLPTEVKSITDNEGNECVYVPPVLNAIGCLVIGLIVLLVLKYWTQSK